MKEIFDVLMYIVTHHMRSHSKEMPSAKAMTSELERAGFHIPAITSALQWIGELFSLYQTLVHEIGKNKTTRVFSEEEKDILNAQCRSYLMLLYRIDILDNLSLELTINRLLALHRFNHIERFHLEWVVLMVLFVQPRTELALARMEQLILTGDDKITLH